MKAVLSYCTQPGRPAPWGWVARICPFHTEYFISSPFPDTAVIFFFRKEALSTWEGSCEHRIYNPILGTVLLLSIWKHWVIPKRESDACTSFIHGPLGLPFDIQDSGLAAGSCHLLPVIFLLVLSPLSDTQVNSGWQNLNAQGKNRSSSAPDPSMVPFIPVHGALWCQRPILWVGRLQLWESSVTIQGKEMLCWNWTLTRNLGRAERVKWGKLRKIKEVRRKKFNNSRTGELKDRFGLSEGGAEKFGVQSHFVHG